jgi:hypothetical protein
VTARLGLAIALVLASARAHAAEHPRVQLEIDACVDASRDEIRRVVAVELGALLADAAEPAADRTRARASCEGAVVVLRVDDPITGKSLSRTIDVGGAIPRARARLVALAIVELISASWTELEVNPRPEVPPSGPRPSLEARLAALESVRAHADRSAGLSRIRVSLVGGGMKFFAKTGLLAGAGLQVARDTAGPFGWAVDAQAHHGSEATSLGRVDTDVLAVGAVAVVHRTWSRASVHLGAGVRGGAAQLSGVPDPMMAVRGSRFWAPWLGPLARGSVEIGVGNRITLGAAIEGGYVVSPVGGLVSDRREVAVDGAWLLVHVGVGMIL